MSMTVLVAFSLCIHYKLLIIRTGHFHLNVLGSQVTTRTHCYAIATSATGATSRPEKRKKTTLTNKEQRQKYFRKEYKKEILLSST